MPTASRPLAGGRLGALLHLLHAFTPDGTPLGTVQAAAWARAPAPPRRQSLTPHAQRSATPLEAKESYRWVVALRQARRQEKPSAPPQTRIVVCRRQRGGHPRVARAGHDEPRTVDWVVRACQDRALLGEDRDEARRLRTYLRAPSSLGPGAVPPGDQRPGPAAKVVCEASAASAADDMRGGGRGPRPVHVCVRGGGRAQVARRDGERRLVREPRTRRRTTSPVEWLLLTSLPIETIEQVRAVDFNITVPLDGGGLFPHAQVGLPGGGAAVRALDHLLPCLAVYLIVAWRTLYVCRLGRACPEISCEAVFEAAEWQSVYRVVTNAVRRTSRPGWAYGQVGGATGWLRESEESWRSLALKLSGWVCNACTTLPSAGNCSGPVLDHDLCGTTSRQRRAYYR